MTDAMTSLVTVTVGMTFFGRVLGHVTRVCHDPAVFWNCQRLGHRWVATPQGERHSINIAPNRFLANENHYAILVGDFDSILFENYLATVFC